MEVLNMLNKRYAVDRLKKILLQLSFFLFYWKNNFFKYIY